MRSSLSLLIQVSITVSRLSLLNIFNIPQAILTGIGISPKGVSSLSHLLNSSLWTQRGMDSLFRLKVFADLWWMGGGNGGGGGGESCHGSSGIGW